MAPKLSPKFAVRSRARWLADRWLIAVAVLAALGGGSASASFFQVAEQCPSGLGNAFAGGAAVAEDACTVWYNPAGMTRLSGKQLVIGAHRIDPSLQYTDRGSRNFLGQLLTGGDGGDAGDSALVPNLYYTHELGPNLFFGLGLNAPFGLTTDYEDDWIGRYHADRSELEVINLNPSLAFKVGPTLSLGIGANYQTIDATLTQAIDFGGTCLAAELGGLFPPGTCGGAFGLAPQQNDGRGKVEADDDAFGWNAGVLWEPNPNFRLGAAYRSGVSFTLTGDFTVTTPGPGAAAFATAAGIVDSGASADVDMPDSLSISGHWQVNPKLALMADWTQTGWSEIPELRIEFASGLADSVSTFDLEDTDRYAIGATITPGGAWSFRLGFATDETPTPNAEVRSARLPDEDRTWYTAGVGWDPPGAFSLALSYAKVEIDEAEIDKHAVVGTEDFLRGSLQGSYDFGIDILSVQGSWSF